MQSTGPGLWAQQMLAIVIMKLDSSNHPSLAYIPVNIAFGQSS